MSDLMQQILGPDGALSQRLGEVYEARPVQLTMARGVERALQRDSMLVVEAGTGTGKTLAYLVPALLSGLKVVISTGTKTLQEQIFRKDLPLAQELLGLNLPVACMKGISNYICQRRLSEYRRSARLLVPDPQLEPLLRWAGTTETGDRAELTALPEGGTTWPEVSPTPDSRIGPRCAFYEECFITHMRRQGAAAQVVVVNHHLLFADLLLRQQHAEAAVLPAYEALILDEAHQLESVATSFFGQRVSSGMVLTLARDARRAAVLDDDRTVDQLTEKVDGSAGELFHLLSASLSRGRRPGRFRLSEPPLTGRLQRPYHTLDAALEALAEHLRGAPKEREDLANLAQRAQRLRDGLALFSEHPSEGYILWAERKQRRGFSLHASPVEVGPLLQQTLLADGGPMVFTSATLAAGGNGTAQANGNQRSPLSYYRQRVGLDGPQQQGLVDQLVLPSPFDFQQQALLYVPSDLPRPNSPEFVTRISERIIDLLAISRGRALVLFTSYRNLLAARDLIDGQLPYPLLCQGDSSRAALLDQFRQQTHSVLLATASFWEGVDVVGESLSLVVMDKLPFAVPDDPIIAARIDLLRAQGVDPFIHYQLPQTALSLKQGFGRLIRHRQDRGLVAVLDSRLARSGYARFLLQSLPPSPRTSDLDRVRAFFDQLGE